MIGATADQLASEEMAQTASLRYPRRSAFRPRGRNGQTR